jgi:hypothetical protein
VVCIADDGWLLSTVRWTWKSNIRGQRGRSWWSPRTSYTEGRKSPSTRRSGHSNEAVAEMRLKEFVGNIRDTIALNNTQANSGIKVENYSCGNCAEQKVWPRKGSRPTATIGRAFRMDRSMSLLGACRNCQSMVKNIMYPRGFTVTDLHAPVAQSPKPISARDKKIKDDNPRQSKDGREKDGLPKDQDEHRVPFWTSWLRIARSVSTPTVSTNTKHSCNPSPEATRDLIRSNLTIPLKVRLTESSRNRHVLLFLPRLLKAFSVFANFFSVAAASRGLTIANEWSKIVRTSGAVIQSR